MANSVICACGHAAKDHYEDAKYDALFNCLVTDCACGLYKPDPQFEMNLAAARAARDEGTELVSEHNEDWKDRAMQLLGTRARSGTRMTGEQIRLWLLPLIGPPKSSNAWGALVLSAVGKGILQDTGQVAQMETEDSHARRTPVWIFA